MSYAVNFNRMALCGVLLLILVIPYASASEGLASWYSVESCQREGTVGTHTASGLAYNNHGMTAAMPHYDFFGWYKVTAVGSGRSVVVLHNDFGPHAKLVRQGRIIDLSPAAFSKIASLSSGLIEVVVERAR